jgi:hypothetical protein
MKKGRQDLDQYFSFLVVDFDFTLIAFDYDSRAFGNFEAYYSRGETGLRILRDRSQVFVYVAVSGSSWKNKEETLEANGIGRERHPTIEGLWSGYEIATQARELREHLETLIHSTAVQPAHDERPASPSN